MSENLSIEEIIHQAEEIRKKTVSKAQSALEDIDNSVKEITEREIEVPKIQPEDIVIEVPSDDKKIKKQKSPSEDTSKTNVIYTRRDDFEKNKALDDSSEKTIQVDIGAKTKNASDKTREIKSSPDSSGIKKSFFNQDKNEPQYSKNPPDIIEKPATIKSKSRLDRTSDLEEVPTIVAVEELEHTRISLMNDTPGKPQVNEEDEEDYQIVLDGFEDSNEKVQKIDEELAEKQLFERRKEKVSKFRLFGPDNIDKNSNSTVKDEYESNDEKTKFLENLFASRSSIMFSVVLTLIFGIILGLLTIFKDSAYMPSILMDYVPYYITVIVIYVLLLFANIKSLIHGLKLKNGINSDFPITVTSVFVLVHTVLMLVNSDLQMDGGYVYPLAIAFALLVQEIGKYLLTTRIIHNFEFLTKQDNTYTVETIANKVDATIISRGVLTGEANLKTSINTEFPTNFMDIAGSDEPADKIAKITGSVMLALNIVLFVAVYIINKDWCHALNIAVCGMCISLPCASLLHTNSALLGISNRLAENGAMINGFEGAQMIDDANAIVIEAQDLFGANSCEIHGIKTFNGAKADDVILKTAAVITKTKSPLASVFDNVIIGKQAILPDVDGIVYEDKLGTSAWIYRKKILVGTRELLIHHGVSVPKEDYEKKYTRKGRKILYLAETGRVLAMFVVSYSADVELKKSLRRLEKSGITILVKSNDPFINDESIAQLFSLPDGYIRVMSASNGRTFDKYSDMHVETSPAYAIHDGSALGFVSAMSGAENLEETRKILSVLVSFGCAVGFGVIALFGILGGTSQLFAGNIILFQTVWCIFVEIVSKIKRLGI